ncbi:unnamed protein product [Prorocentrum cordatum]|uniref:Uncharacterized protein n=1 Tax=Prorocentrum cordatum TaxID=2364126 RepID=A0ABN9Q8J3_9DINO|nr:unnamed protein product [Polarella glacialis]
MGGRWGGAVPRRPRSLPARQAASGASCASRPTWVAPGGREAAEGHGWRQQAHRSEAALRSYLAGYDDGRSFQACLSRADAGFELAAEGPEEVQRLEAALSSAHEYWWCAQPVATEPAAPAAGGGLEREAQRLRSSLCLVPSRRGAFRAEAAAVRQRWEAERAAQGAGRGRGRGRGADALLAAPLGTPRSPGALSERAALVPGGEHDRNRYEKNGRQTWSKGAWMSDRLRFHGKSRISAAERGGTSRILGRAPPPVHGFGDRAPNPWIANPCLRAPDMGTETDSRSSGGET